MTPYGERALDAELVVLRATGNGGRNEQLNRSAFAVAQLVGGEQLDAGAAKAALAEAARHTGLDAREIAGTIDSAWPAGLAQPRGPEPRRDNVTALSRQRRVAAFEYQDADGVRLYRNVRLEPGRNGRSKEFRHERPDGRGGWITGRGGDAVPYRLPDLIAAAKGAPVFMAEGEAKADKLAGWGLVATSSKGWRGLDAGRYVKGRTVFILPDNDDAGRKIATEAAEAVERAGGKPVLVDLPGLPERGDVLDWTGTAAELLALADAARAAPPPNAETFALADLGQWAVTEPEPRRWALDKLIPQGEVTLFTGAGGAGKSLFAQQLATCYAAGLPMLGVATAGGPALYITAEDDARELHWRQGGICRTLRLPMAALAGRLHLASLRGRMGNELATFDAEGRLQPGAALATLRATIATTGARLVLLDNVAHLFVGNENDRSQVTAFANLLSGLCLDLGVTIVLIGHPNKAGDDYSGSTAWLNAVRSQLTLRRAEGLDPDARELVLGKANYARQGEVLAFRWHDHALILDSELPDDRRAEMAAVIAVGHDNGKFLACLAKATADKRAVSHVNGTNYAPRIFAAMPEAEGVPLERLRAAMERLLHLGMISLDQPLWRGPNRVQKQGIKLTSDCTDPPASTPRIDPHRPLAESGGNPCIDPHASTPLYTTYNPGGAADGPPPGSDQWHENPVLGRAQPPAAPDPDDLAWPDETGEDE